MTSHFCNREPRPKPVKGGKFFASACARLQSQLERDPPPGTASTSTHDITGLLQAWNHGDENALNELTALVYTDLYASARRSMRRVRPDNTVQTTALINELYIRLVDLQRVTWQNRAHFFAVCARLMRNILVDLFRSAHYLKRGGGLKRISLDASAILAADARSDLLAIDEALTRLAQLDFRKSHVIELRFFGGLSVKETAEVLKVSQETVMRDWKLAKAWLLTELSA